MFSGELITGFQKGGDPAAGSPDGYLVTTSPQSLTLPWSPASLRLAKTPSGKTNSHGVTGGVYKARERIHRGVLIRDY